MEYKKIVKGTFLERPNRFIAKVMIKNQVHTVHVKNTGKCKELLVPGATVYLEDFRDDMRSRKTEFSIVSVEKISGNTFELINMDSQAPNKVVEEALFEGKIFSDLTKIIREQTFGNSRLDFYYERTGGIKGYIEVKGVTLEENGIVKFPDAKTERGVKHIKELIKAKEMGFESNIIFIVQMKCAKFFIPNFEAHMEFGTILGEAIKKGVSMTVYNCNVTPNSIALLNPIDFTCLQNPS
jgi:sugar fermentation stimulation protein A